jgi:2-dehydropantoate 2-reductase
MNKIQKVAILGAGAMGAYFASRFYDTPGFSVVLIANGPRYEKLKREGLIINNKPYLIPVLSPEDAHEPVDLILVALKHHQLAEALTNLDPLVGSETTFISVMNGLESESIIASFFGEEKVLCTISVGIDAVREGNRITYTKPGRHIFGEQENSIPSPKVLRVQEAFKAAGIQYETPVDMLRMLWWKFMINVGVNQASAVLGARYGVFHTDADAQTLMEALMQEVVSLAQASNVNLTQQDVRDWYPVLNTLSAQGKTSMLQDIEAGRKTEVDVFGGKIIKLGKSLGIQTPVNETIVQIIKVLEKKYQNE